MTFAEVIIKRFDGFIETHSKPILWEVEVAEEMQRCIPLLKQHDVMVKALEMQEKAEEAHANCDECGGEEVPELCPKCFPLYDDARIARRGILASVGSSTDPNRTPRD